jgi:tRNA(fMet)-specific endonuclease VapC
MNGRYLLDTNVIIALFAKDPQTHQHLSHTEEVFIPCTAVGELCFGARKSQNTQRNLDRIDEFIQNNTVLPCDTTTAKFYGETKQRLKEKGQPIPENDIWIAAVARQYSLTLATKDSHFESIEDLVSERW